MPLALPEPLESRLQRMGVEPWMIAEDFDEYWEGKRQAGTLLSQFEKLNAIFGNTDEPRFSLLSGMRVHPYHIHRGKRYNMTEQNAWALGEERMHAAALRIATEELAKRERKKWRNEYRRALKKGRAA